MAGLDPAIHVFASLKEESRGCPGQARAWRTLIQSQQFDSVATTSVLPTRRSAMARQRHASMCCAASGTRGHFFRC